ncbi:ParB N-terminal domain-containing protein [Campylobacter sp. RM16192]|uniref:ParB N-terminal domain-containing protein n=1 Tax=Campylobacter sp. RM16192 TaxID=1660080 RepID=UPI001597D9F5|nr:ParB N-terminal domain-containing protein [Campylobacter sp. RM16192]QKU36243.1 partitioning protein ParB [Campylobacter sp. RM16192]
MKFTNDDIVQINLANYKILDKLKDRRLDGDFEESRAFKSLVLSIKEKGILVPLIFAKVNDNTLEVISGRRRLRAVNVINSMEGCAKITTVPAQIINSDMPLYSRYLVAFDENRLRSELSDFAQVEALFSAIFLHLNKYSKEDYFSDSYSDARKNIEFNNLFFQIKGMKNKKEKNLNKEEAEILTSINYVSKQVALPPEKVISSILSYKLIQEEKILIVDYGLSTKQIYRLKKDDELSEKFSKLCKLLLFRALINLNFYQNARAIAKDFGLKLSTFYEIPDIDNEYNENVIKNDYDQKQILKFGNALIEKVVEILLQELELKKEAKKNSEVNIMRKKLNAFAKSASKEKLEALMKYMEKLSKE